jgi:phosphatidylserine decarboxylase
MNHSRHLTHTARMGRWLPSESKHLNDWLTKTIDAAEQRNAPFHPVIEEFRSLIENDPEMYMYFTQMFEQQPHFGPPAGSGDIKLKDYDQMLVVINHVLTSAPEFNTTGMVGCPINAILDFPMITRAGLAAFLSPKENALLKKVLRVWTEYLDSPASRSVLNTSENGWLSPVALLALQMDDFIHDPKAPHFGFKSWNDFFIRQLKPGVRPIAEPDNNSVIVSACESAPFAISTHVKEHDRFWLKSQPYSLRHMLDGWFVDEFADGTVYQAFLSPENYHRWHSPISGTIKKIRHVDGTYYSEAASEGFDPVGPNNSQGYIAHTATRALIFIETDEPVGLMCLIPVGMSEVSSCVVTAKENTEVKKGDQIGYFQFGGSTHCLVFRKGVVSQFAAQAIPQRLNGAISPIVKVNSLLAVANSEKSTNSRA